MKLTAAQVRAAEPRARPYKIADGQGLHLYVAPTGRKSFRMAFRFGGKAQLLTFGRFPALSLADARDRREDARRKLRDGVNPAGHRARAIAAAGEATFEPVARAWLAQQKPGWSAEHCKDVMSSLERDVFPAIGALPITMIGAPAVLEALREIEARGSIETAKRVRQRISGIFQYAISEDVCAADPASVTRKALKRIVRKRKQPSLTDPDQARAVLVAAEAADAELVTKLASRFLALTVVRPGVVRRIGWDELEDVDWSGAIAGPRRPLWRVPAARMKLSVAKKEQADYDHLVPLPWQAVELLRLVRRLTGGAGFVFPGRRKNSPLAINAIGALYRQAGFAGRHVPHGWRATFSTTMKGRARRQKRPEDLDTIELMLAHELKNKVAGAYDRDEQMERRRVLAQEWADIVTLGLAPATALFGA